MYWRYHPASIQCDSGAFCTGQEAPEHPQDWQEQEQEQAEDVSTSSSVCGEELGAETPWAWPRQRHSPSPAAVAPAGISGHGLGCKISKWD